MILSNSSPLRAIPAGSEQQRGTILNGIRVAIDIIDVSYDRLINELLAITKNENYTEENKLAIPSALSDAWNITEAAHQLRTLVEYLVRITSEDRYDREKIKVIESPYSVTTYLSLFEFVRNTENVTMLRNIHSHLKGTWQKILSSEKPVWGTLYWVDSTSITHVNSVLSYYMYSISGGTLAMVAEQIDFPKGPKLEYPIGWVTLTGPEYKLNISDLFQFVKLLANRLEQLMGPQFEGHPRLSGDKAMKVFVSGRTEP